MGTRAETEDDRFDRLYPQVKTAMQLAKDHGFRPIPDMCGANPDEPDEPTLYVVGRSTPGECYEVISFRGLDAQAVRCEVTPLTARLILLDETQAGTAKWTGAALEVVKAVVGADH